MKYRVSDTPLRLRAYGRNVQSMIEYAKSLERKEDRTRIAEEIVRIMVCLDPDIKENPDYEQQLWDHLFMIAEYDFDIDAPYPVPPKEDKPQFHGERMNYPEVKPRYRQYGKNVENMVQKAAEMPEGPAKTEYLNLIANIMKQFLANIDRENTPDTAIAEHIRDMSNGQVTLDLEEIEIAKPVAMPPQASSGKNNKGNRNRGGNRRRGGGKRGNRGGNRGGKRRRRN
jgi:hypothetical protein